jgi:hypothetical protein
VSGGVVSLEERKLAPNEHIVALFEDLLQRAKDGRIRSVALAMGVVGNQTSSAFEIGDGDVAHLVCSIERVKLRLLAGIGNEP